MTFATTVRHGKGLDPSDYGCHIPSVAVFLTCMNAKIQSPLIVIKAQSPPITENGDWDALRTQEYSSRLRWLFLWTVYHIFRIRFLFCSCDLRARPFKTSYRHPTMLSQTQHIDDVLVGEIAPVLEAALWNDTGHIKDRYKSWLRERPGGVVKRGQRTGAKKRRT